MTFFILISFLFHLRLLRLLLSSRTSIETNVFAAYLALPFLLVRCASRGLLHCVILLKQFLVSNHSLVLRVLHFLHCMGFTTLKDLR